MRKIIWLSLIVIALPALRYSARLCHHQWPHRTGTAILMWACDRLTSQ